MPNKTMLNSQARKSIEELLDALAPQQKEPWREYFYELAREVLRLQLVGACEKSFKIDHRRLMAHFNCDEDTAKELQKALKEIELKQRIETDFRD
jgi:hypothetical protein